MTSQRLCVTKLVKSPWEELETVSEEEGATRDRGTGQGMEVGGETAKG